MPDIAFHVNARAEAMRIANRRGLRVTVHEVKRIDGTLEIEGIQITAPVGRMLRKIEKYGIIGRTGPSATCGTWEQALDAVNSLQVLDEAGTVIHG